MATARNHAWELDIADALDWWREAGVDADFADVPRDWLAEAAPPAPPRRAEKDRTSEDSRPAARSRDVAPAPRAIDAGALPADLAAFRAWWASDPSLDEGPPQGRVPPLGEAGARFMVVVPEPEPGDRERLLAGPQGRLLDAILAAFGTRREDCYLASLLPRPTPAPDWRALAASGIGKVLAHHIALVAPQRLVVLGANVLPLIGHELPQRSAVFTRFDHERSGIPMLVSRGLGALLNNPRMKAELWKTWLDWPDRTPATGR